MNNSVKIIFAFTLGAAVGVVATRKFFETKYAAIAQEEIDSVKEVYSKKHKRDEEDKETPSYTPTQSDVTEYEDIIDEMAYVKNEKKGGSEPMKENNTIEVIPPDDFGEDDDYDLISITYYANGILTDDGDFPIEDIEGTVGPDALDSFGEWEDDAVYVKNNERKCYYEILRDNSDYVGEDPSVDE